jgi:hypothetical protein
MGEVDRGGLRVDWKWGCAVGWGGLWGRHAGWTGGEVVRWRQSGPVRGTLVGGGLVGLDWDLTWWFVGNLLVDFSCLMAHTEVESRAQQLSPCKSNCTITGY